MNSIAAPFTFNPPTASELVLEEPEPTPAHRLRRRVSGILPRMRRVGPRPTRGALDARPEAYYVPCKRSYSTRQPCNEELQVYRVTTGTLQDSDGILHRQYVYYWRDTAIVVETGTDYSPRPSQDGFCSMKCLSLWAAKIARDTGQT